MRKFRGVIAFVLSLLLVLSGVGCGSNDNNDKEKENKEPEAVNLNGREITFVTWVDGTLNIVEDSDDELMQTYYVRMKEMEKKYNCTFVFNKVGESEILPGLQAAEMGGTTYADVILLRQAKAISAYNEGILLDLSQVFDDYMEQFYQPAINPLKQEDGKFYSIAFYNENPVESFYFFNKEHFENQGIDIDALYQEVLDGTWTFERLAQIAEKATVEKNGKLEVYGAEAVGSGDTLGYFLAPFGAQVMVENEDGTYSSGLKTAEMQKALETLSGMYQSKYFWKQSAGDSWDTNKQLFLTGKLAMFTAQITAIASLSQTAPFEVGVLPIPKSSVEDEYTYSAQTLNVVVMPASLGTDMKTAQAIADMLTYIYAPLDEDVEDTIARKYSMYTSNEKMVQIILDAALSDNFVLSNYIAAGQQKTYNSICKSKIGQILNGQVSIKAGTDAINDAWQTTIDEYNAGLK